MNINDSTENDTGEEVPDDEVREFMESHDLDQDTAEQVREIIEEYGINEDDAIEFAEAE